MPVYAYACNKCGHEFEIEQRMSDPPRKRCPKCRSGVRKVFHPVGVVLKGSGFYKTDSRAASKSSTKTSSGDSSPAKFDDKSTSKSNESAKDTKSTRKDDKK